MPIKTRHSWKGFTSTENSAPIARISRRLIVREDRKCPQDLIFLRSGAVYRIIASPSARSAKCREML